MQKIWVLITNDDYRGKIGLLTKLRGVNDDIYVYNVLVDGEELIFDSQEFEPLVPEYFARTKVIGSMKLDDDLSMLPHRHVIMTRDRKKGTYTVHLIAFQFQTMEWVSGGQGYYDMPKSRALKRFNDAIGSELF